jgi:hypothetical protein
MVAHGLMPEKQLSDDLFADGNRDDKLDYWL